MKIFRKMNIKSKVALILSGIALIVATINIFAPNEIRRTTVWVVVILVWVLDYMIILQQYEKICKKLEVAQYEIGNLKGSYISMGRYIDHMNLPELEDIDTRISNELNDIEIKKEDYAKRLGIKP
jgi:hypothetical protein